MGLEKTAEDYEHEAAYEKAKQTAERENIKKTWSFKIALYERAITTARLEILAPNAKTSTVQKTQQDILLYEETLAKLRKGVIC